MDARLARGLQWRQAGPFRGGRVVAVAGHPERPGTFFFGAVAGGVFKTEDGAATWRNVSDGFFQASSVGALAVSSSEPSVIYAGMGEACIRGNVVAGDGVWRSPDGGRSWEHRGLSDTRHIARVRVHPHDPDLVYVAAFGHAYGPNPERGVFRTRDGGRHWDRIGRSSRLGGELRVPRRFEPRRLPENLLREGAGGKYGLVHLAQLVPDLHEEGKLRRKVLGRRVKPWIFPHVKCPLNPTAGLLDLHLIATGHHARSDRAATPVG